MAHGSELGARKAGWLGLSRNIDHEFLRRQGGTIPWEIILKYAEDLVGYTIRDRDEGGSCEIDRRRRGDLRKT